MYESVVRFRHMRNKEEVERRVKILGFWEVHGEEAARDALGVSHRTLYRWQKALRSAQGKLLVLDPQSTAPRKRRTRQYDHSYLEKVITLRRSYPRLGKQKIAVLLGVSASYAGRTLGDLARRNLLPFERKLSWYAREHVFRERRREQRKKHRRPPGTRVVQVDTVVRFVDGLKRYIVTGIDTETRFAFALCYANHSSASAADFLAKYRLLAHIPAVQTDNGSEFAHLFDEACTREDIPRYHTYPRSPRMNGTVERFNRTLSEDWRRHYPRGSAKGGGPIQPLDTPTIRRYHPGIKSGLWPDSLVEYY